jgi:hypothetical protein
MCKICSISWLKLYKTIYYCSSAAFNYISSVNAVKASQKVVTPTGRLRLLIRSCLVNRCLHVPVEILVCLILLLYTLCLKSKTEILKKNVTKIITLLFRNTVYLHSLGRSSVDLLHHKKWNCHLPDSSFSHLKVT